jgi:cohesin complex subunit SA-1/2
MGARSRRWVRIHLNLAAPVLILRRVFVHRYRDTDPAIRTECVHAIGQWFQKYPAHFLGKENFLRYVGWVLSDASTAVRVASVKALEEAYKQTDFVATLTNFTERFKSRLVEMARRDTDLHVRTAVVQVLAKIDENGYLEDEQREELCLLVFDEEPRVRAAVAGFVNGVWKEATEERLVGRDVGEQEKSWTGLKALAGLLVKWGKALDKAEAGDDAGDDDESQTRASGSRPSVATLPGAEKDGRIPLVVDALWDEVEAVSDWQNTLELLLLDHSANTEAPPTSGRGRKSKNAKAAATSSLDDAWRLEDVEEGVLLEVLVSSLQYISAEVSSNKKVILRRSSPFTRIFTRFHQGDEDDTISDITRALIKGLPALFVKHQTDANRIIHVLRIPELMNLDLYLEMRMMTVCAPLCACALINCNFLGIHKLVD